MNPDIELSNFSMQRGQFGNSTKLAFYCSSIACYKYSPSVINVINCSDTINMYSSFLSFIVKQLYSEIKDSAAILSLKYSIIDFFCCFSPLKSIKILKLYTWSYMFYKAYSKNASWLKSQGRANM